MGFLSALFGSTPEGRNSGSLLYANEQIEYYRKMSKEAGARGDARTLGVCLRNIKLYESQADELLEERRTHNW